MYLAAKHLLYLYIESNFIFCPENYFIKSKSGHGVHVRRSLLRTDTITRLLCKPNDDSAGGLLAPEGIILPVVSVSELTWFIIYTFY